jgi:hypothetical protein
MTQLGSPVPPVITEIRKKLMNLMRPHGIRLLDASEEVTGRDFLLKIWEMILSVPIGIAIVDRNMTPSAMYNVYFEIGVMQAYGKETIVIRTPNTEVPSDFIRTEYVMYDPMFGARIRKFIARCKEQGEFYLFTAQTLKKNPPLAFDYFRRAYLMTGNKQLRNKARQVLQTPSDHEVCNSCLALESSWMKPSKN